jgi:hypothetical protein
MREKKALRLWCVDWNPPGAVHASASDTVWIEIWRHMADDQSPEVWLQARREVRHPDGQQMLLIDADHSVLISPAQDGQTISAVSAKAVIGDNILAVAVTARFADWGGLERLIHRLVRQQALIDG